MARRRGGLTFKDMVCDHLLSLDPPSKFKNLKYLSDNADNIRSDLGYFTCLYSAFMEFDEDKLREIIFEFLNKWPTNTDKSVLEKAASAIVYSYHYKTVHGHPPSETVSKRFRDAISGLILVDEREDPKEKARAKRKQKDMGDDVAIKLREMPIEDMLAWETELGVPADKVQKHKELYERNKGMARMQIGLQIRKHLPANQTQ
jgi:hypothetical protein